MVDTRDVGIQALSQIYLDVAFCLCPLFHDDLGSGQIRVELVQALPQLCNFLLQLLFLVIELYRREFGEVADKAPCFRFKVIHSAAQPVFLLEHLRSDLVECIIVDLEYAFHFELMAV